MSWCFSLGLGVMIIPNSHIDLDLDKLRVVAVSRDVPDVV